MRTTPARRGPSTASCPPRPHLERRLTVAWAVSVVVAVVLGFLVAGQQPGRAAVPTQVTTTKVLTIMLENHSRSQTRNTGQMPYLDSLANTYGDASNVYAVVHPSLGNYFAAQSGAYTGTCGKWDPLPGACPQTGQTVMDQAIAAGRTAKYYSSAMPSNCYPTDANGYIAHHNPWAYFTTTTTHANCLKYDVPSGTPTSGALRSDVAAGTLPTVSWLIGTNTENAHSASLSTADAWLKSWIPVIMAGPDYQAGRLAIAVTFDEPDPAAPVSTTPIEFVLISPHVSARTTSTRYDLYSWLRYQEDVAGVPYLGAAATAADLRAFVPIAGATTGTTSSSSGSTSSPSPSPTTTAATSSAATSPTACTPAKPAVVSFSASSTGTSAVLSGRVDPNGSATSGNFEWGTTTSLGRGTGKVSLGSSCDPVSTTATVSGLTAGVRYYYRLVAESSAGNVYPAPSSFVAGTTTTATATPTATATASPSPTPTTSTTTASPSPAPATSLPLLRSVNKAGSEYACIQGWGFFDGPADQASVTAMKSWNVNAVRIPLNEDCWLAVNGAPAAYSGSAYRTAIANYVSLLHANGLYAILDLHWSAPGTTKATGQNLMADRANSIPFWTSVAGAYKGDAMTLFDLYNEPHGVSWSVWKSGDATWAGMDDLIRAVRSTGAGNWVVANGLEWGNDLRGWLANRPADPAGRLMAGAHVYNFNRCVTTTCWSAELAPVRAKVPLIVTEMGENDCASGFVRSLFDWGLANGLSGFSPWAWNRSMSCTGGPGLVTDNAGTATAYGAGVRDWYRAH